MTPKATTTSAEETEMYKYIQVFDVYANTLQKKVLNLLWGQL